MFNFAIVPSLHEVKRGKPKHTFNRIPTKKLYSGPTEIEKKRTLEIMSSFNLCLKKYTLRCYLHTDTVPKTY